MIFFVLLFVQISIFGALIAILRYVLKRYFGTASNHLETLTQECTAKLAEAKKRMEEANTQYQNVLTKAKEDGERLKQQFSEEGIKAKEETLNQARGQSEEIVARAQTAASILKEEMEQKVNQEATKKTLLLVRQLLTGKMSQETHSHWISELSKSGFDGLNRLNISDDSKEIEIVSAYPLKPAEKTMLLAPLKQKFGREIPMKEKVSPELILGVRLTIGNVVIDGTLQYRIEEAIKNAKSANS